jgi:hypothetical protein
MRVADEASPFGPSFGAFVSHRHRIRPVRASSAKTDDESVWTKTVPPATIGVDASEPYGDPVGSRNRHRTDNDATEREEIDAPPAARAPSRPAFGCGQPPAAAPPTATAPPTTTAAETWRTVLS